MTNTEQIAAARKFLATPNLGKDMARELNKALAYIRELADIAEAAEARVKELEAATRVPVQGEPSRITGAKISTGGPRSCQVTFDVGGMSEEHVLGCGHKRLLQLPRATVPDAATEESEKRAWAIASHLERDRELIKAELASRIEDRDYWYGIADKAASQRDAANEDRKQVEAEIRDLLKVDIPSLKAERDAATAAIESVRVVTDALRSRYSDNSEAAYFMGQIVAALDGAPEPEWEREYRRVRPDGTPVFNAVFETMPLLDDYYTAEYRTVSPWLPAVGESK